MKASFRVPGWASIVLVCLSSYVFAQSVTPSNDTQDLYSPATSPRFILNGSQLDTIPAVPLAPLGQYAELSHTTFQKVRVQGHIVNVDASNANDIANTQQFSYVSCDPEAYSGNLGPSDVFRIIVNSPRTNIIILYSETSNHCAATGLSQLPTVGGILTTTDSQLATALANLSLSQDSPGVATIFPDMTSYTNSSQSGWGQGSGAFGQSPTTAVAMIILYAITGIITALFVTIIITGTIRAHRHPERYGPRNLAGRGRQSRAKGIARAMLETLPIVKFGDHDQASKKSTDGNDIEMNDSHNTQTADSAKAPPNVAAQAVSDPKASPDAKAQDHPGAVVATNNADGTDAEGHLGCSICTDEFQKGQELRVLPCNHKFHPDCVDPWLLNVSGTCPLCRIDLRPPNSTLDPDAPSNSSVDGAAGDGVPPLGDHPPDIGSNQGARRDSTSHLRDLASGTRDERITALRRLRLERLHHPTDAERQGLTSRFRERFRIRTERRGATVEPSRRRSSAVNVPSTFFG
ncbi:hypothetical protein PV10_09217 [Exophiala mesophila]|uniref:RING-type domain-containing protein n=1 Tax=Exophiala mesophila TaxID=212818 RepID=A0A0D1ZME3_EXOME|nr:uncharacterized protein PV10_09217 [Exophiala mesophila]KIV87938.1 hypothetical protein PV10_09217 [Exophiala mesophila]